MYACIGSWSARPDPAAAGIRLARYLGETGGLEVVSQGFERLNVGNACVDAERGILYCTDESATNLDLFDDDRYRGHESHRIGGGGRIFALRLDRATESLQEIDHKPSFGSLPSHVAVDGTGSLLLVTHHTSRTPVTRTTRARGGGGGYRIVLEYDAANTVLFPLNDDGSIAEPSDIHRHTGRGGPLGRQTHAQLHSVMAAPSGDLFAVCDKGNDRIVMFRVDRAANTLVVGNGTGTHARPGSSPRYATFHPTRPYLYVNFETMGIVEAYRYGASGELALACTASALPTGVRDSLDVKQSDIRIHPSGRHLYSLVRGCDAVSVFSVSEEGDDVRLVQWVELDAKGPRGCAISPDGLFLFVAAVDSDEVISYAIGADGKLSPTGFRLPSTSPGSITFLSPPP